MENTNDIEKLFKESFDDYKVVPDNNVWNSIQKKLWLNEFFKLNFLSFNFYYLVIIVAITILGIKYSNETNNYVSNKIIANNNNTKFIFNKSVYKNNKSKSIKILNEKTDKIDENIEKSKIVNISDSRKTELLKQQKAIHRFVIKNKNKDTSNYFSKLTNLKPIARYIVSKNTGCAPLTIDFNNKSKNAYAFEWDFGNGIKSKYENPICVYEEPGTYNISLKAIGVGGISIAYNEQIVVYEKPNSNFRIESKNNKKSDNCLNFINNSESAKYFEWSFGDANTSKEKTPTHCYNEKGVYDIKLNVWSQNYCFDSLIIYGFHVEGSKKEILFPNAFVPNPSGENMGIYSLKNKKNDVFYPVIKGVTEYELNVYTKSGVKIFTTKDINKGWNGFYNGKISPADVYVWKTKGKYYDGTKFNKSGNVTLLHK